MNDPVPHEGESDGAMLSAPTPHTPTPQTPVAHPAAASARATSDRRPFSDAHDYEAALQRQGFESIGEGGGKGFSGPQSVVMAKPGSERDADATVIKLALIADFDPWPAYAEWCRDNPGPFRVPVRSLRWHGTSNRFYVATMDRLWAPLNKYDPRTDQHDKQSEAVMDAVFAWYDFLKEHGVSPYDPRPHMAGEEMASRLAVQFRARGRHDIADYVMELHEAFPHLMFDPQPSNWMWGDGRHLIWIDPFLRSPVHMPWEKRVKREPLITVPAGTAGPTNSVRKS